jgi:Skp family chaperone for outer membrane proteins
MQRKYLLPLALIVAAVVPAGSSFGQAQPSRIAVANPGRIFNEMQELKDLKESLDSENQRLKAQEDERRSELTKLQAQRNQLKADSPQWDKLNNQLMEAVGDFQLWAQKEKMKADRNQKRQIKALFQHIEEACGEVAQREGFDIVISDQRPEIPENLDTINFDQLRALISSRNVLYTGKQTDISDAVIALVDSKYKAKGGAAARSTDTGTAAPAPAPTPAPRKGTAPKPAPAPAPK